MIGAQTQKLKKSKVNPKKIAIDVVCSIIAIVITAIIIFPILWILPAAFKPKGELFAIPNTFFPKEATLENFRIIFSDRANVNGTGFLQAVGVTTATALIAMSTSLFVNMLAAYAFACLNFRAKKFLWIYILFTMFVPGITIMLTSIRVVNILSMNDTLFALFVPGMANAYNIFFFRQYFYAVPASLDEAASIDGASRFRIFFTMYLPMSFTPIVIIGIGVFIGSFNSYIWPTLTISNNPRITQVMQIINSLSGRFSGNFGVVIAATAVTMMIPITIFAIFQRTIVRGIFIAGLK